MQPGRKLGNVRLRFWLQLLFFNTTIIFILVAAGYALYGSATMIVLALGNGPVNGFMLDPVLMFIIGSIILNLLFKLH